MDTKKYKKYLESISILLLGIITSFSLPPYNYWFINFFTFSLLFTILIKNKKESLNFFALNGYLFGFGFFLSNMYWIPLSLLYDNNYIFLIPVAIFLIPAFLSLFHMLGFLLFKLFLHKNSIFINILIFSVNLGLLEFIRGSILSGFPWNLFAYSFSENISFIQITSLTGIYAFNTFLITIFCAPSILLFKRKKIDLLGFYFILTITLSI